MVLFANLDFGDLDQPGYGARAAARLDADLKAGARGLKIFKNFGMSLKRAGGAVCRWTIPSSTRCGRPVRGTACRC